MRSITWHRLSVLVIIVFALASCGGGDGNNPASSANDQRGNLISATAASRYAQQSLADLAPLLGLFATNQVNITYDVEVYKLAYWTIDPAGDPVQASGLIAVPLKAMGTSTALLSFQHGTIFHNLEAPTNYSYYESLSALVASMDFIVTVPDYLGYGDSATLLHPYLYAESTGTATIDLLRAARQWLDNNSIGVNNQLFLAGFSEGGYATLVTHKMIQERHAGEFTVTASSAGAGPYDLLATANYYLDSTNLPYAAYISFSFKAYDDIYDYNRISEIFQPAYVDPVNNYFYGDYYAYQIDAALTNVTADLFDATFLSNFRGSGETVLKADLVANSVYDWAPTSPVRLYHGLQDSIVPYVNATTAVSAMTGNGATDVMLIDCPAIPSTHGNCGVLYLDDFVAYFLSF